MSSVLTSIKVPFHRPSVGEEEVEAVSEVLRSGWLTTGVKTAEFERRFADYLGVRHAVAVSSGTAALHLSLEAVDLMPGDEVLVPTTTFTATAEAVTYTGARPVLVDIDPQTMNLDPEDAERKLTPRTRAIIPVHLGGQPAGMAAIHALARSRGLRVVEDAAHALPAWHEGRRVGTLSELTAFSFYATKTLTTGEGGMVTTDNDDYASRLRWMRLHGIEQNRSDGPAMGKSWSYKVSHRGFKYNLTDLQSAIGIAQLARCDAMHRARLRIAQRYSDCFASSEALETPRCQPDCESSWHLYILRLRLEDLSIGRDRFIEELDQRGVSASVHFIPLHLQPWYQEQLGYEVGDFPVAEAQYQRCLSLPIYPGMTEDEIGHVIESVLEVANLGSTRH